MKPVIVLNKGVNHQVVNVAKALFHSSMVTSVINSGGRFAINMETNELTIIRGQAVLDFYEALEARKRAPVQKVEEEFLASIDHVVIASGSMSEFVAMKPLLLQEFKAAKASHKVGFLKRGDSYLDLSNKCFWMIFNNIGKTKNAK